MDNKVWVCGRVTCYATQSWQFQGVFRVEALAIAACRDETYFIGPAVLDVSLPEAPMEWPESYYPMAKLTDHAISTEGEK